MDVLSFGQVVLAQLFEGLLHGIEGIHLTGQNGKLNHLVNGLWQIVSAIIQLDRLAVSEYLFHLHAVKSQGTSLVRAEHSGRT